MLFRSALLVIAALERDCAACGKSDADVSKNRTYYVLGSAHDRRSFVSSTCSLRDGRCDTSVVLCTSGLYLLL